MESQGSGGTIRLLKLAEVEQRLGVSRWTLYSWLRSGKLLGLKLACGHYRVPASEVERFARQFERGLANAAQE